jgi:hypothetical protein
MEEENEWSLPAKTAHSLFFSGCDLPAKPVELCDSSPAGSCMDLTVAGIPGHRVTARVLPGTVNSCQISFFCARKGVDN